MRKLKSFEDSVDFQRKSRHYHYRRKGDTTEGEDAIVETLRSCRFATRHKYKAQDYNHSAKKDEDIVLHRKRHLAIVFVFKIIKPLHFSRDIDYLTSYLHTYLRQQG